ncbi:MAG: polyprenyl synthetase family protein [Thaumarchaeota archaeon]|nr:polyprenyl synthetase family protein [Nitrososphaerota archaeon]
MAVTEALSGGKRVRAVLALLWCEGVSGDYRTAIPVAVAYELAHAAALVQDDILDDSEMRRGDRSIVRKHGLRSAMLASNMLLAQVPRVISEYGLHKSGGEVLRKLFELLGDSFGATVMGEFLDLEMAERDEVEQGDYDYMIRMKTGALIGASSASGAVVGGGLKNDELLSAAYESGEWLGMAYQVQDDLLDIMGDEQTLGKPIFADIRGGKKNAVLIHVMGKSSEEDRAFLRELLRRKGPFADLEVERVRELLLEHESVDYARRLSAGYAANARKVVENVELGDAKKKLIELSDYLASRKY